MITTVIGIGQSFRGDDGAGLAAVACWAETYPETASQIRVELAESPGVGLLHLIEDAGFAILVDAVQSGAAPGTIHTLKEGDLATFLEGTHSAHGWGLAETLALGRKLDPDSLPETIAILGIEAGQVAVGVGLSPEVENALPEAARLIQGWLQK